MEGFIGGTETQLALHRKTPESKRGLLSSFIQTLKHFEISIDLTLTESQKAEAEAAIDYNNQKILYGIPVRNLKERHETTRLFNGGLIYEDLGHIETAIPELKKLDDFPVYEQACAEIAQILLGKINSIYRAHTNQTDYRLDPESEEVILTFAYQENYHFPSLIRQTDSFMPGEGEVVASLMPFLVTRQIFAGSGMYLPPNLQERFGGEFSISQRSLAANIDHFNQIKVGRHSHLVAPSRSQSKEVIQVTIGDRNRLPYITKLKIGTTALILQLIADGWRPKEGLLDFSKQDLVESIKNIALDPTFKWKFNCGKGQIPAIEVQREYLEEAFKRFKGRDEDTDWTLEEWEKILNILEKDPMSAPLEWVHRKSLLARLASQGWSSTDLRKADLCYHAVDKALDLLRNVKVELPNEEEVRYAMFYPPQDTRAMGRGILTRAVANRRKRKDKDLPFITWDHFNYKNINLGMPNPFDTYSTDAIDKVSQLEGNKTVSIEGRSLSRERK